MGPSLEISLSRKDSVKRGVEMLSWCAPRDIVCAQRDSKKRGGGKAKQSTAPHTEGMSGCLGETETGRKKENEREGGREGDKEREITSKYSSRRFIGEMMSPAKIVSLDS